MDENDLMSRYQAWRRAGLIPDHDAPRYDAEMVGRTYSGHPIFRAHDGRGRYSLFCDEITDEN